MGLAVGDEACGQVDLIWRDGVSSQSGRIHWRSDEADRGDADVEAGLSVVGGNAHGDGGGPADALQAVADFGVGVQRVGQFVAR